MNKNHIKKHLISILILLFVCICSNNFNYIFGEEVSNNSLTEENNNEVTLQQNRQVALKNIDECKENIREKINIIDEKIKNIKQKDEYKNYPAIRLNVDTPIFGLSSICNQKLKITIIIILNVVGFVKMSNENQRKKSKINIVWY